MMEVSVIRFEAETLLKPAPLPVKTPDSIRLVEPLVTSDCWQLVQGHRTGKLGDGQ